MFGITILGAKYELPVTLKHRDIYKIKTKTYYPFGIMGAADKYLLQRKIYHTK
jgi:hypothetical protein